MATCYDYSTNEAHNSNTNNNSILPWYRKALVVNSEKKECEVMALGRHHPGTVVKRWPRVTWKVKLFIGVVAM